MKLCWKIFSSIICFSTQFAVAQVNLVPNWSFENYSECPQYLNEIYKAIPWFQPSTFWGNTTNSSSSDYFNICAPPPASMSASVPQNLVGIQNPKSGTAYSGISLYLKRNGYANVREYIEVKMQSQLEKNKEYCVDFFVSLADTSGYAISNIGIYFSNDSLLDTTYLNINVIPQIKNPDENIIMDKENWVLISGEYIATGGEQFITIGNFDNDNNTNYVKIALMSDKTTKK